MKVSTMEDLFSRAYIDMLNVINDIKESEIQKWIEHFNYEISVDDFNYFFYDILLSVVSEIINERIDKSYKIHNQLKNGNNSDKK